MDFMVTHDACDSINLTGFAAHATCFQIRAFNIEATGASVKKDAEQMDSGTDGKSYCS